MSDDPKILQKLGENIRRKRVEASLTQEQLSEMASMDITNLQRIESGRYNTKALTLMRLQKALEVSWEELFPELD